MAPKCESVLGTRCTAGNRTVNVQYHKRPVELHSHCAIRLVHAGVGGHRQMVLKSQDLVLLVRGDNSLVPESHSAVERVVVVNEERLGSPIGGVVHLRLIKFVAVWLFNILLEAKWAGVICSSVPFGHDSWRRFGNS